MSRKNAMAIPSADDTAGPSDSGIASPSTTADGPLYPLLTTCLVPYP